MLLEAQKGPESLQEALRVQAGNHRSQQEELRAIIDSLQLALDHAGTRAGAAVKHQLSIGSPATPGSEDLKRTRVLLESLPPQIGLLRVDLGAVQGEVSSLRNTLESKRGTAEAGRPSLAAVGEGAEPGTVLGRLQDSHRTLGQHIRTGTVYNAVFSYTAAAATVCALYLLLGGGSG